MAIDSNQQIQKQIQAHK